MLPRFYLSASWWWASTVCALWISGCAVTDTATRIADGGRGAQDVATVPDAAVIPERDVPAARDVIAVSDAPVVEDVPVVAEDVVTPTDRGPVDASTAAMGLPCDITQILATWCTPCHSDPPRMDAVGPLRTRAPHGAFAERSHAHDGAGRGGAHARRDGPDAANAALRRSR